MKHALPNKEKKEATTQATLSQKESSHSFFGSSDSFFTKPAIQAKTNNTADVENAVAEKLVQKFSAPVPGNNVAVPPNSKNNLSIQRKCDECEQEDEGQKKSEQVIQKMEAVPSSPTPPSAATGTTQTTTPATVPATARFIVDDNAIPEAGQMRKSSFLERLKMEVCDSVNQAMAGTPFSSDNCPYIRASFDRHQGSSPVQIEALIFRYCPSAAQAQTAEDVIQQMKVKVYAAALQWARNGGDLSGASQIFGGIGTAIGSAAGSVASGIGSAAGSVASGIGNIASGIGGLFFKENTGGAKASQSPQGVMQSLGKGNSMEGGTRSKMEGAFGTSFSNVEVHTDSNAAQLSSNMNARAFTVGNHIAFASGEYQPGSLIGDALMAHELAHTIQQSGEQISGPQMKGAEYNMLEVDADNMAMNAMTQLAGGNKKEVKNKVKRGLAISRCKKEGSPAALPKKTITVNITYLKDGSTGLAGHLTKTNEVYKQASIEVTPGTEKTLDEVTSKAIIGNDLILDEYSNPSSPTTEEQNLLKENRAEGVLTMYYVKSMSAGSYGEAFWPATGNPSGFVFASPLSRTWPHELGHVLLNSGNHPDADADNFMAQSGNASGKEIILPDQVTKMRESPFVK